MNILDQFKHQWKVYFKRGAGEAVVYGNTEDEAKVAALAAYPDIEVIDGGIEPIA